jgi:uncharacterized protein (DUF488 family)
MTLMTRGPAPRLVSIGYEGRNVSELIHSLQQESVSVLVDVRLNAISRKPGLSKTKLAESLRSAGIGYVHLRELGNPKDNREGFRNGDDVARERFWNVLRGDEGAQALKHVSELLKNGVVALLCFEVDHRQCHRGLVTEALIEERPRLAVSNR